MYYSLELIICSNVLYLRFYVIDNFVKYIPMCPYNKDFWKQIKLNKIELNKICKSK